jgi:heme exporter protein D
MAMDALATYVSMGGYAGFVWPAYGIAAAVLGGLALQSWRHYRASRDALASAQRPRDSRQ